MFLLQSKLRKLARQQNCGSLEEYYTVLREDETEIPRLLDQISTNKTDFFREQNHWTFLRNQILPGYERSSFRTWSAACSSGEEPFSLGMELEEHRRQSALENYRILGTDLSNEILRKAVEGTYRPEEIQPVRNYRPDFVSRYFESSSSGYRVDPDLQDRVCFRTFNLRTAQYPFSGTFQLILCRNVLIYFDDEMIEHVINQLTRCLETGGYLMIGHTENLNAIDHSLTKVRPAIFRK